MSPAPGCPECPRRDGLTGRDGTDDGGSGRHPRIGFHGGDLLPSARLSQGRRPRPAHERRRTPPATSAAAQAISDCQATLSDRRISGDPRLPGRPAASPAAPAGTASARACRVAARGPAEPQVHVETFVIGRATGSRTRPPSPSPRPRARPTPLFVYGDSGLGKTPPAARHWPLRAEPLPGG